MKLITKEQLEQLLKNGQNVGKEKDLKPAVKLFMPDGSATWLLVDIDPENPDLAFGLCDLGLGFPELGYVSLKEISSIRGQVGLAVERDRFFTAEHPISVYAEAASQTQHITEDRKTLLQAKAALESRKRK